MAGCKITVLKRTFHQDLVNAYKTEEAVERLTACTVFRDNQEFMIENPWAPPEGFCPWAWADIRQYVMTAFNGGKFPGADPANTAIACCTDGVRPVIFKVEGVAESDEA